MKFGILEAECSVGRVVGPEAGAQEEHSMTAELVTKGHFRPLRRTHAVCRTWNSENLPTWQLSE
jgi:hypothetical protein